VAFLEHPLLGDDRGYVDIVDLAGNVKRLTQEWSGENGLAWSPSGSEIWFSAGIQTEGGSLYAVTRDGRLRTVLSTAADLQLHDISADGRVLMASLRESSDVSTGRAGHQPDLLLDIPDESVAVQGISADGSLLATAFSGTGGGHDYSTYAVKSDGSAQIRLGDGAGFAVSPDNKWMISMIPSAPNKLVIYPTGAGQPRPLDLSPVQVSLAYATWTSDGTKLLLGGREPGKAQAAYLLDMASGRARAVTPEGTGPMALSPDGKVVLAKVGTAGYALYPVSGGTPVAAKGIQNGEIPLVWDSSGTKVYLWDRRMPIQIVLADPRTGERKNWLKIEPGDGSGLLYGNVLITPDGKSYVYRLRRVLTNLYLATGLR
jgi:eukaryotic-like serine/threonine-protein kinase